MTVLHIELQIARIYRLISLNTNTKTLRVYCRQLVMFMEKIKTLTAGTVSA